MGPFEAARARGNLRDRQGRGVIDIKRARFERFGSLDKATEFALIHVTLTDFMG